MKYYYKIVGLGVLGLMIISLYSCKKYLEKTPEADVIEADIFRTFNSFQGYVETMYADVIDQTRQGNAVTNFGDDVFASRTSSMLILGDYQSLVSGGSYIYFPFYRSKATRSRTEAAAKNQAIWQNSWFGIRAANISLSHLKDLIDATDEQKKLIEGQSLFFRGNFHWELMKVWGAVPFVDTAFVGVDIPLIPQLGLYETVEKVVKDLDRAIELLPLDWDQTVTGQQTQGNNAGRATKGMAMALKAECLLYAASPLFNGTATGNYEYNLDYCKKAAKAAWEVIELANQGIYTLEPWDSYSDIFYRLDNTVPRSKETIFFPVHRGVHSRYTIGQFDLNNRGWAVSPTENYAELFGMANGLPVDDSESGFDPKHPWDNREPRFYYNFLLDGEKIVKNLNDDRAFAQFYIGGNRRKQNVTGYNYKKYWNIVLNPYDNGWSRYFRTIPKLRLAEIYLFYAEMVNEAFGPDGVMPGADLTALDAVNIVRHRANVPDVNPKFTSNTEIFRDIIWTERAVELAFESKRWYDLRRWHVATELKYRELYSLEFDKDHTYFKKVLLGTTAFFEKHYWMRYPVSQVNLYSGWKQNPGW